MSDGETIREDARRDAAHDKLEAMMPDDPCECGMRQWFLVDTSVYGDDADGNRGVPLRVWECHNCERKVEVTG